MGFAEWLRVQLLMRGWTQAELAKRGGIQASSVSQVINGTRGVGTEFCLAVARAFRIPAAEVYREAGLLPPAPEQVALRRIWALLQTMNAAQLEEVDHYARYLVERDPQPAEAQSAEARPGG